MATLEFSKTYLANIFRAEGKVEEARESVLKVGGRRFGNPPTEVENSIQTMVDLAKLHRLRDRLFDVGSWQELLAE